MEQLRAEHLTLQRGSADVLTDLSLVLRTGERVGLVGRNGAGKTTLLRLLAGELTPTEGRVVRSPGVEVAYLQQGGIVTSSDETVWEAAAGALVKVKSLERDLRELEKNLDSDEALAQYARATTLFETAGGYGAETALEKMLLEFSFTNLTQPVTELFGGERTRLALVRSLAASPEVLLLDEPTNHLDLATKRTLAEKLVRFPGVLLVASHDRALLNAVCTYIAYLDKGRLELYRGNYARFRIGQAQQRGTALKKARESAKERARLQEAQRRLQRWGTPKAQRQRKSLERRLEPPKEMLNEIPRETSSTLTLEARKARGTLLKVEHLSKSYEGKQVVDDVWLRLEAGDKLALVGPNGSGKSTLLKLLAGETESDDPRVQHYWHKDAKLRIVDQQTKGVAEDISPFNQLTEYVSEPRAYQLLALVGVPESAWTTLPETLSGGERARLGVALLIASEANVLLLDEPTNDLDIVTIETLEDTLASTNAAVLFVTHDEHLVEAVATRVASLEEGRLTEYRGGIAGYFAGRLRVEEVTPKVIEEQVEEESLEVRLERLEDERMELENQLFDPLALTERELERLEQRRNVLLNDLSELYNARLPPPPPRYQITLGGVTVTTNGLENARAVFTTNASFSYALLLPVKSVVAHVVIKEVETSCSLGWARVAGLRGVAQVAFEHLNVNTIQLQSADNLSDAGFRDAGGNWWTLSFTQYERLNGFSRGEI